MLELLEIPQIQVCGTYNAGVNPASLAITPDGKYAYVANNNNYSIPGSDTVSVLNLHKKHTKLIIHDNSFVEPYRIAIDCKGKFAYVCNSGSPATAEQSGTVSIINTNSNKVVGVIPGFDGPGSIVLSKKFAYVTNYGAPGGVQSGNGKTVSVVDLKTNKIVHTITVNLAPAALALDSRGKYLYVISYVDGNPGTGTLTTICTKTNCIIQVVGGLFGPFGIALTKDDRYAYVTNFGSNNFAPYGQHVSVINLKKNCIIKNILVGIQPSGIAVSENFAYVSNYNTLYAQPNYQALTPGEGTLQIISLEDDKVIGSAIPVGQSPSSVVLSPDEKKLYVCKYIENTVLELSLE